MNQLITTTQNDNGEIIVSGRELHEFLEIKTTYTQWFERMIGYGFVENVDFIVITKNVNDVTAYGGQRKITDHHLKLDMAKELSMIQRTEKGKQARLYFLNLERLWNSPEMVMKRAMTYLDAKVTKLEEQIKQDKPYTTFGKAISNSDASINVGAFAKLMYDEHGIKLGRNKMFQWLRDNGFLIKHGRERNNPKQKYIEQGLFETTVTLVSRTQGDVESLTTLITGKGQVKLAEILINEYKAVI